jgi:hypothetical protein
MLDALAVSSCIRCRLPVHKHVLPAHHVKVIGPGDEQLSIPSLCFRQLPLSTIVFTAVRHYASCVRHLLSDIASPGSVGEPDILYAGFLFKRQYCWFFLSGLGHITASWHEPFLKLSAHMRDVVAQRSQPDLVVGKKITISLLLF